MHKLFLLMLVSSITAPLFSQTENSRTDLMFNLKDVSFRRVYTIELGGGNRVQLSLMDVQDIQQLKNADALLKSFLNDIQPLKDSLEEELASRRIDYLIDTQGRKKIRMQLFKQKGSTYLLQQGELSTLKIEQDTVNIIGMLKGTENYVFAKRKPGVHYYQLSFFINQLSNLSPYTDGRLNSAIATLDQANKAKWKENKDGEWIPVNGDGTLHASRPAGYLGGDRDMLAFTAAASIQNYKNYFAPSFMISAKLIFSNTKNKYELGLAWEPYYVFATGTQGTLQTFRNDFISLNYASNPIRLTDYQHAVSFDMFNHISIAYLIKQRGNIFDDHTIRISTGGLSLYDGRLRIEPALYLPNIFNKTSSITTPGIRITLSF